MGLIEKFWIEGDGPYGLFGNTFDFKRIVELPDEDFARLYLEQMTEYRDRDGWWSGGKIHHCEECHGEISGPSQLRRYEGRSMHPKCFRIFHKRESHDEGRMRNEKGIMKTYWERVARLNLD